jgi:hypothetical protein
MIWNLSFRFFPGFFYLLEGFAFSLNNVFLEKEEAYKGGHCKKGKDITYAAVVTEGPFDNGEKE